MAREALKCFKLSYMGDPSQSSERQNADRNADSKDQDQEISDRNKDSIGSLTKDQICCSLAENLFLFAHIPKLSKRLRLGFQIISLVKEVSKCLTIQHVR